MAEKKEPKETKSEVKGTKEAKETKTEIKETKVSAQQNASTEMQGSYVFVGKKSAMAYVLAVVTQFGMGANEVTIKARGKSISRAVDVAEIVRSKSPEIKQKNIITSTEDVLTMDGRPLKVSAIEIVMKK